MPPRNAARSLLTEAALADRVAYEREKRGWTYEGLAKRMTDAGCAINQSGLYKVEKGEPPRRITVDELVAFSQVFRIPVEQMLLPPAIAASKEAADLLIDWNEKEIAAGDARRAADEAWVALKSYAAEHPEVTDKIEEMFGIWATFHVDPKATDGAVAYRMALLTDDPARRRAFAASVFNGLDDV